MRKIAALALLVSACSGGGGGGGSTASNGGDADRDPIFNIPWERYSEMQRGTPRFKEGKADPIRVSYFRRLPLKGLHGGGVERYIILQSKGYTAQNGEENPEPFGLVFPPMVGSYVPDGEMRQLADQLIKLGARDLPDFDLSKVDTAALREGRFKDTVISFATPEFRRTVVILDEATKSNRAFLEKSLRISEAIESLAYGHAVKIVTQVDRVIPNK